MGDMDKSGAGASSQSRDDAEEPLLAELTAGHYKLTDRQSNDRAWSWLYAGVLTLSLIGGVYGATHRNAHFGVVMNDRRNTDPALCPDPVPGRRLLAEPDPPSSRHMFSLMASVLTATVLGSLASGLAFLHTVRHQSLLLVRLALAIQIAMPTGAGLLFLARGMYVWAGFMLSISILLSFAFLHWRDFIPLCARLLSVAAQGLSENKGLVTFAVLGNMAAALLLATLLGISGVASTNGRLVPKPARVVQGQQCIDAQGRGSPCCTWAAARWTAPFQAFNALALLWTLCLAGQVQLFVTSGTIAQWYFAPQGNSMKGAIMRSLGHALGPSFGSLCFGAAILTVVQLIRNARNAVRVMVQARGNSNHAAYAVVLIVMSVVFCVLEVVLQLVEFLTSFATIRLAVTGERFMLAARSATDLLARNSLKSYGVWFFPPMVLHLGSLALAALWGILVYFGSHFMFKSEDAALLGILAGLIAWAVNAFYAGLLLSIVDAVYFCYALDRDTLAVTKQEVHEVYAEVPVSLAAPGVAVQQPGGDLAYGTPNELPGEAHLPGAEEFVPLAAMQTASNSPLGSQNV